jgi:uncharacterized heparinase superfamily protein
MTGAEMLHRIGEQQRRTVSRFAKPDFAALPAMGVAALPVLPGLAEGLQRLTAARLPIAQWRDSAARTGAGRWSLLGREWPGLKPAWHLDPDSGRYWPAGSYCFDIAYRGPDAVGDPKLVWELNRLQHVQAVAALAAVERDAGLRILAFDEIANWIASNPPFRGINWASGVELASRVVSILVALSLLGDPGDAHRTAIARSLAAHFYWLRRYPSLHSSANNHLIAETAVIFVLARLAPWLPGAAAAEAEAAPRLIRECDRQILADGIGAEQSPSYASLTCDWLALAGTVAARSAQAFPAAYWERLDRAASAIASFGDGAGNLPRIGDDDDSVVLVPPLREAMFGGIAEKSIPDGVRHFTEGGYTVARETRDGRRMLLAFDHGPAGLSPIAAHGHADTLALWFHVDEQPVLVDAGTFLYFGDPEARRYFRSTRAHNTVAVAGANSSEPAGPFLWRSQARARVLAVVHDPLRWSIAAEHDGYCARFGVVHRREVRRTDHGFTVSDTLVGEDGAPVEIRFLFHPDLELIQESGAWTASRGGRPLLRIRPSPLLPTSARSDGWYSPSYGVRQRAPVLASAGRLEPEIAAVTQFEILGRSPGIGPPYEERE